MPTYEYRCNKCMTSMSVPRAVEDRDTPITCPTCKNESTRVYSVPSIQFKGTGFYSTGG